MLQPALVAVAAAMILTLYEMGNSLKPTSCPECPHCRAKADADQREQDRLRHEYSRRVGLDDREDDDRRIG